jgi:hypothetical protein
MQNLRSRASIGMLAALGWGAVSLQPAAAQPTPGSAVIQRSDGVSSEPVYQPPMRGAPSGRVGGGTRGTAGGMPTVDVLAPDHVGLTVQEQPTLYWFVSAPVHHPVQLTLVSDDSEKPLAEVDLPIPSKAGIQAVKLSDVGVKLKSDVEYQWTVAIVVDASERSKDILASGIVKRTLDRRPVAVQDGAMAAKQYAAAGLWYDALEAASRAIDRAPGDHRARMQRAALLDQAGLAEAAAFERSGAN